MIWKRRSVQEGLVLSWGPGKSWGKHESAGSAVKVPKVTFDKAFWTIKKENKQTKKKKTKKTVKIINWSPKTGG